MTNKEKKEWLSGKYPLTVIQDRYVGVYSGARWLAFPLDYTDVPEDANGDDTACAQFWHDYKEPVGKGGCAEEAMDNLLMEMEASIPKEIDEEKVRKFLLRLAKRCPENSLDFIGEVKKADVLAYLEKQKEQNPSDLPAGFYFIDQDGNKYYSKEFRFNNGTFTTTMKVKEEQKSVEWSEEDEKMRINILNALTPQLVYSVGKGTYTGTSAYKYDDEIKWLKSLRPSPSWKPSEDQIRALERAIVRFNSVDDIPILTELRDKLKKL